MYELNSCLYFSMRAAMKRIDRILSNRLEPYGITIPQMFVLICLYEENGITLKEIGNRTLIDSSSMTVLIDKLEKDGLVKRQLNPEDRRAINVLITEKGHALAQELIPVFTQFNVYLYDLLGEGNQKEFTHGIRNMLSSPE